MASPLAVPKVDLSALSAGQAKFQLVKAQVEAALEKKAPSALTVRERPAAVCLATGVAEVDALAGGSGVIPRGGLSEITGPASSGRTALLFSLFAQVTARQELCALVDASGSFDPASAEAAGVELERVLWVRCGGLPNCGTAELRNFKSGNSAVRQFGNPKKSFSALERCLRVADLLLMSGGFGLVALDLGDVSPDAARRVSLTTWFRFRRAVEDTPAALVVLEQEAHARSCAAVVLELQPARSSWQETSSVVGPRPSVATLFTGLESEAALIRGHAQKKFAATARPARFQTKTVWAS